MKQTNLTKAIAVMVLVVLGNMPEVQGQAFENGLGMKFVPVPGTKILMATTEVTVDQYKAAGLGYQAPKFPQGGNHPAVNVSWNDAKKYQAEGKFPEPPICGSNPNPNPNLNPNHPCLGGRIRTLRWKDWD